MARESAGERARAPTRPASRRLSQPADPEGRGSVHRPLVVAIGGMVASGKSTLARALAERMAMPRIVADRIRDQQLDARPGRGTRESGETHEVGWAQAFEAGFHERVYAELLRRADLALGSGRGVVLDGCFARACDRVAARDLAQRHGLPFRFVECRVDARTQRARLEERDETSTRGGWRAIAAALEAEWEPVEGLSEEEHLVLDTSRPLTESVAILEHASRPDPTETSAEMPVHPPAAVTFDCWQTLIYEADWSQAHARRVAALVRAAEEAGRCTATEEAGRAFDVAWERHMACWRDGIQTGAREVALDALARLGLPDPHPALEHLVAEYQEASHSSRVAALDGALQTLGALASAGVRRALVCDTGLTPGRVVRRHLDRLGLLEHLEVCAFSDEVGAPKPDAAAFRAALEPLGVLPADAVHVGDLRRTDVAGARAFGMGSIRIRARHDDRSDLPEADATVDSHAELRRLLGVDA